MQARLRKIAVFVGAAALASGVGVGAASQGGESTAADARVGIVQGAGSGAGGPHGRERIDLAALAEELGVTEAELRDALRAARPDPGSGVPGRGADSMIAAIAAELGLSESRVARALESFDSGGGPPPDRTTPPADGSTPDSATGDAVPS